MINILWFVLIILGIVISIFNNNVSTINLQIIESGKNTVNVLIQLLPIMSIWMGIINIAKESGLLDIISRFFSPIICFLFPDIPKGHKSISLITSNIISNMFGLGNASTPLGLEAMRSLQELNNNKDQASDSMITFLVLNTSGLTLIPTTVISLRSSTNSVNPTEIVLPCIIATFTSTILGLLINKFIIKLRKKG